MAKNLRWYIKPHTKEDVNTLLIPKTNHTGTTTRNTVSDKDEIILVKRNTHKLIMSNIYPFTAILIDDTIVPHGDNDDVDKILNRTATHATLGLTPNDVDKELDVLIQSLQRSMMPYGAPINDMDNTITLD